MKLWDGSEKGRSLIAERWDKLYEIHFNKGISGEEEHIVDFEVVKTKMIEGGKSGFSITLAVFTTFNQYLVYETTTTLLANLKTLSTTTLLYHVYTTDCVKSILSTVYGGTNGGTSATTYVALVSEVDPKRQRKELLQRKLEKQQQEEELARKAAEAAQAA